jgi:hypothetical protein
MVRFFGAFQEAFARPIVNKYNNLGAFADLVATVLESSYFICVKRDPPYHAQSLLKARREIHGDLNVPYGLHNPRAFREQGKLSDYVIDVCTQVAFHERMMREKQAIIGRARFWIIDYEEFCEKPEMFVQKVSKNILRQTLDMDKLRARLKPFPNANRVELEPSLFNKIQKTLAELAMHKGEEVSHG